MTHTFTLHRLELARAATDPAVAAQVTALLRREPFRSLASAGARDILAAVKAGGDAAVRDANRRHGGGRADGSLLVPPAEMAAACAALPPRIRAGLEEMIRNIRRFAETQLPETRTTTIVPGVEIERRLASFGPCRRLRPGRFRGLPKLPADGRPPGEGRRSGDDRRRLARRRRGRPSTRRSSAPPGWSGVDVFVVAGGAQAVGALAYGLPKPASNPWIESSGREALG